MTVLNHQMASESFDRYGQRKAALRNRLNGDSAMTSAAIVRPSDRRSGRLSISRILTGDAATPRQLVPAESRRGDRRFTTAWRAGRDTPCVSVSWGHRRSVSVGWRFAATGRRDLLFSGEIAEIHGVAPHRHCGATGSEVMTDGSDSVVTMKAIGSAFAVAGASMKQLVDPFLQVLRWHVAPKLKGPGGDQ